MKAKALFITFIFLGTIALGQNQVVKQIYKIYEENKFKEVVNLGGRIDGYLTANEEKGVDDVIGRSYYALQMYDSTIYFENKAIRLDNDATSTSGWAYTYRGVSLYRLGKKQEGIIDLQKAIDLDKTHNCVEVAKEFLSEINTNGLPGDSCGFYISQGEYKNAIEEGRQQLQKHDYKSVMELVGIAYINTYNYDSAVYYERKALAIDKDSTLVSGWAHVYLGIALYNKNEKDEAITELRKAIELDKMSNSVHKAENFLDNIINGRTVSMDSLHENIKDQLRNKNYRGAAGTALTFLAANPGDATAWAQLSAAYCWLHSYDSSLYSGQRTIALDKEQSIISSEVHYYMGIDRFMKNDFQAADNEFTAVVNEHAGDNLKKKEKHTRLLIGLDDTYSHWKTVETDNIIFHFQNKRSIDDVDAFMEKYEKEYANASKVLPVSLPRKIDLFVWEHDNLARNDLQNGKEIPYNNADYCVIHVAQSNNPGSEIMHILGYWQKTH